MNQLATPASVRQAQVWAALEGVSDPELDESVVELGFVTAVEVDAEGAVDISFRLPTYWCSSNFASSMCSPSRTATRLTHGSAAAALRMSSAMMNAKFEEHQ